LPEFTLRPYCPADAAPLLQLFQNTIRRVNCRDYAPAQIAAWTSGIELPVWTTRLESRWCMVAEMPDRQLGGFVDLETAGANETTGVHLDRFYVSADHQRCGIGRALLVAAIQHAAEMKMPRIYTEVSITARPFFLSHGFRVITDQLVYSRGAVFLNYRMEALSPYDYSIAFRPSKSNFCPDFSER
jgi:putative acetyltransferase